MVTITCVHPDHGYLTYEFDSFQEAAMWYACEHLTRTHGKFYVYEDENMHPYVLHEFISEINEWCHTPREAY